MSGDDCFYTLVFDSTSHSIQTEKAARDYPLHIQVIPTPPEISSNCGLAIKITGEEEERILSFLKTRTVPCRLYRQAVRKIRGCRETELVAECAGQEEKNDLSG